MSFADSLEFTAYDPNNPSNSKSVSTKWGSITGIPEGWKLKGEITMPKNKYLMGTGSDLITARDFEMEVIDESVNNSHVKYTTDDYDIKSNLHLGTYSVTAFNHVTYHLNGGTWTDTTLNKQPNLRWDDGDIGQIYQAFITPKQSVYKPTDPTREGYKFLGWKSSSDIGKPDGTNSVHMNEYNFKEVDVNNYSGYALAGIVHLTAQWEALVTNYVDEDGNELSETEKGLTEEPKDIDGYKHIRTDKDEDGNITHVYKKNTLNPEIPREDEIPTPRPEDPGEDDTPTPSPDPKPEAPGEDGTPTPDLDPEEDDQNIIPGPGAETDKDVDESDTSDDDNSTDKTDDSTDESETSDEDDSTDKTDDTDESDTSDETETTDKSESTDKDDTPKKTIETYKKDTEGKTEIENEDSDISSDKLRVPRPSTTISSNNQVSSPARSSVVTRSSNKGASNNVQTGVSGAISVASILAAASAGLYATRKKEDEEE